MARAVVRSGNITVDIDMRDVERATRTFKEVRNSIARDVRSIAADVATDVVLPYARLMAPHFIAATLVIRKGRANTTYLTTRLRGKQKRVVGLLEFGGTVKAPIVPKTAKAIFGPGFPHPVARVDTPRTYKGKHFMGKAVWGRVPAYESELAERLARRWNSYLERFT